MSSNRVGAKGHISLSLPTQPHRVTRRAAASRASRVNTFNFFDSAPQRSEGVTVSVHKPLLSFDRRPSKRLHSRCTGFIFVALSSDTGESVGMRKSMAVCFDTCTAEKEAHA